LREEIVIEGNETFLPLKVMFVKFSYGTNGGKVAKAVV